MEILLAEDSHLGKAGQRVNLELTQSDVRDPTEIPSYLAGYKNWTYRADEASKVILVDNDEDSYRTFSEDDAFQPVQVKNAATAAVPEISTRSALSPYKVVDRFIGSFIPKGVEIGTSAYNARMAASRRCSNALNLDRELDVLGPAGLLTSVGNWAAGQVLTLAANEEWNGGSTSDPVKALQDAVEASAQPVSECWMNQHVANLFIRHASVRDHMRQLIGDGAANGVAVSLAQAQTTGQPVDFVIPGLPPIKVSSLKYKNASNQLVYVMPNYVALTTTTPGVPMDGEEIATSYTFRRRGPSGVGLASREFHVEGRGPEGGTMVVVAVADVPKMTGNNCGGLITAVVQ